MVYTNNNLKNKRTKKQQSTEIMDRQKLNGGLPVYPFDVDVASIPERKYLAGVYFFAKFTCILLGISLILCALIVWQSYKRDVNPILVSWNKLENTFEYPNMYYRKKPEESILELSQASYLNEFFIRTYLDKRFGISKKFVENYNNWCDCSKKTSSNTVNDEQATKVGYFNLDAECYVCKFSDSSVYSIFFDNEYSAYNKLADEGETRRVEILDMKQFRAPSISGGNRDTSLPTQILDYIFKGGSSQTPVSRTYYYRVDFLVEIIRDGKIVDRDVMIGYIVTMEYDSMPQIKKVIRADYVFNPNYDMILKEYKKK